MDRDLLRRVAVVVGVVGGAGLGATGDYGSSTTANTLIVPADATFGVWGPIYAGALAYAVEQARPSRASDATLTEVGWPVATAYLASGLWVRTLEDAPLPVGLGLVGATAASAVTAAARLGRWRSTATGRDRILVHAPIGLFAGWISLAAVVAGAEVLADRGVEIVATEAGGAALLVGAAVAGAAVTVAGRVPSTYPAALVLGLTGVAAARSSTHPALAAVATAAAGTVAAAGSLARRRRRAVPDHDRTDGRVAG